MPPPDEEFLDQFQQDFVERDPPKSQEEGRRFSQRCPGSWKDRWGKSSPLEEKGVSPRK